MRLWRNNPETPEGKYPIVLRRDGSALQTRYIVMTLRDPATEAALLGYAFEAERLGYDPNYVQDIRDMAEECPGIIIDEGAGDPMQPPHRVDDPVVIAWARSLGSPGG